MKTILSALVEEGGVIKNFLEKTVNLSPAERATALEEDTTLAAVHENHASTGQTATPDLADNVDLHFVCLVERDGHLYELDGNKPYPINHGPSSKDSFLFVSSMTIVVYMAKGITGILKFCVRSCYFLIGCYQGGKEVCRA